jgi:hypothetical protein
MNLLQPLNPDLPHVYEPQRGLTLAEKGSKHTAERQPWVRKLGTLSALRGGLCGREYDGPSRWFFDGF